MQQQYADGGCRRGSGAVIMPMHLVHCGVSGTTIYRVTDLEDAHVIQMVCPVYDKATGTCCIRRAALRGGPAAQFERPSTDTLARHDARCVLW